MLSPLLEQGYILRPLSALLLLVASIAASLAAVAGTEVRATVLSIGDGDTIRVQPGANRITIRLACIYAREMEGFPMASSPAAICRAGCWWAPA